jgi:hypothetical protein
LLLGRVCDFYAKYECVGLKVTFVLIALQVIHLFWLSNYVIFGTSLYTQYIPNFVFASIDYIEIPALFSGIIFYSMSLYLYKKKTSMIFISVLFIQFIHLYWITDEFIVQSFTMHNAVILTWVAILIDYAEIPVMVDLFIKIIKGQANGGKL